MNNVYGILTRANETTNETENHVSQLAEVVKELVKKVFSTEKERDNLREWDNTDS